MSLSNWIEFVFDVLLIQRKCFQNEHELFVQCQCLLYLESCIVDRCGGGGVVSDGEGSLIEMNYCTVRRMRQMGIEDQTPEPVFIYFIALYFIRTSVE
jgi:hypothetical protein